MANAFYRERVSQHLKVGLETMRILRDETGLDRSTRASSGASTNRRSVNDIFLAISDYI